MFNVPSLIGDPSLVVGPGFYGFLPLLKRRTGNIPWASEVFCSNWGLGGGGVVAGATDKTPLCHPDGIFWFCFKVSSISWYTAKHTPFVR